jgi:IS5 family transposase
MRRAQYPQLSFHAPLTDCDQLAELQEIDKILDANPQILELVHADLVRDIDPDKGSRGLSAETVLRILALKQRFDFTYKDLVFHLGDSPTFRWFCRLDCAQRPKKSTMQHNVKKLQPETLQAINCELVLYAMKQGIEPIRKVRTDCTGVETLILKPTDSSLLNDSVRVLARLLGEAKKSFPNILLQDHTRRAKRRFIGITNARDKAKREKLYRDLIKVTEKTVGYAERAVPILSATQLIKAEKLSQEILHYIELAKRVLSQTRRRVLEGESVPAADKIVSIFEPHTDILVKGNRDPMYGHKVCVTAGASGMILDSMILDGNPADSTLTIETMTRLKELYDKVPHQATFDGAFSSLENLTAVKELGVQDVVFAKSRGIEVEDMARSKRVYKKMRNFRAGIEATISFLKRCFALGRCTWRSLVSFKSYVWGSILSANLLIMARHALQ